MKGYIFKMSTLSQNTRTTKKPVTKKPVTKKPVTKKHHQINSFILSGIQKELVDKYIHFIPLTHQSLLFSVISDDVHFIHFHIFAVWFLSSFNIFHYDFHNLYQKYKHIPFHSFLFHISNKPNNDNINHIIDF
jgi:hypothetical protein